VAVEQQMLQRFAWRFVVRMRTSAPLGDVRASDVVGVEGCDRAVLWRRGRG